jgi:predicted kinase
MPRRSGGTIPDLVHLNGPAGVGKSTVAAALVEHRPLGLALDIDALRTALGRWAELPASKAVARDLGFAMAARHLAGGHDVALPQLVVRPDVVAAIEAIASAPATFHEVVLVADRDELVERLRHGRPQGPHPRLQLTIDELAGEIDHALAALGAHAADRPQAHLVDVSGLGPEDALAVVRDRIGW